MGSGIRSAMAAGPRSSAADTTPETSGHPACPLITAGGLTAIGILLARPGELRRSAAAVVSRARILVDPVSVIRPSLDRAPATRPSGLFRTRVSDRVPVHFIAPTSVPLTATTDLAIEGWAGTDTAIAGTTDTATVGAIRFSGWAFLGRPTAGAGAVGDLAWDGRTGRTDGTPGGTARTGMLLGLPTTTTERPVTPATTIRRRTILMVRMTTIRRPATRLLLAWTRQRCTSTSTLE